MRTHKKFLLASALVLSIGAAPAAFAGSTLGGVPNNGGGVTFGLHNAIGGQAVADAIASGDPAQIEVALQSSIAASFPGGTDDVDLEPMDNLTGPQTVALLTRLIQDFARAVGLPLTSPSIQELLRLAQTAIT